MKKSIMFKITNNDVYKQLELNCEYRNFLYNHCVDIIKSIEQSTNKSYYALNKFTLLSTIREEYEKNDLRIDRPDFLEDYDYYFRGISECVVDDIELTAKIITYHIRLGEDSKLNNKPYDKNNHSFRFKNKLNRNYKPHRRLQSETNRLKCVDNDDYSIVVKVNNVMSDMILHLSESVSKSMKKLHWDLYDVREISFKKHNDIWFLILSVSNNYIIELNNDHRVKICGIDIGEENPVVLYDGKVINIPKYLEYPKKQIKKYNRKIENCKRIMDRKYNKDLADAGLPQSKRYYKVLRKFHKYWERHNNILKDWHFKLAHWIVTHYKNIVVDEFHNHIVNINSRVNKTKRKRVNHSMLNKAMFNFTQILLHMSHKYGTNYYQVTKLIRGNKNQKLIYETTDRCCICNNINKNKLKLDHRIFKCESCGYTINRDVNAAINCYNLYKNKSTRKLFLELI